MRQLSDNKYTKFKYFLECYFNPSVYYSELDELIGEFNRMEPTISKATLLKEIQLIISENSIDEAKEFIKKHGMRNMPIDKVKWFIDYLSMNVMAT